MLVVVILRMRATLHELTNATVSAETLKQFLCLSVLLQHCVLALRSVCPSVRLPSGSARVEKTVSGNEV